VPARAAILIREWREGVGDQWLPGELTIDHRALPELFKHWEGIGLDRGLLLYMILGTEWIFRARPISDADLERELGKIESGFAKTLEPWQASLVTSALAPSLRDQMKGVRYLVSLGRWTEPDRQRVWEMRALTRRENPPQRRKLQRLIETKTGLGPIA
jgi:hypothetical protein